MKLVFQKFEQDLDLCRDALNVLRIESPSLFARCALSLRQGFPAHSPEPAFFFNDEGKELKSSAVLFFAGDLLFLDLNDKRIVAQAAKTVVHRIVEEGASANLLEQLNLRIEDVLEEQFFQMSADYRLADEWDLSKYLKALGFGVDDSEDATLYDRLRHFARIAADLFSDKVIALVNLPVYLSREEYNDFCKYVASLELCVLSYELGDRPGETDLENVLFIDADYLER